MPKIASYRYLSYTVRQRKLDCVHTLVHIVLDRCIQTNIHKTLILSFKTYEYLTEGLGRITATNNYFLAYGEL